MKRIVLLGSTGSIGGNTLDVVSRHSDRFELVGLAARASSGALIDQCDRFPGALFAMTSQAGLDDMLRDRPGLKIRSVGTGEDALVELIQRTKPDLVLNALVGFVGLKPTMEALSAGIPVAIANKETIVCGGEILLAAARDGGAALIPIDSEHVAIRQCLGAEPRENVERIVLTASGGSLRDRPVEKLAAASVEDVLAHPTWNMGAKITVDSATLVNKGLEIIEAHWLFDMPFDKIDVVIHPQSIVHSFVEFIDGSIIAQMGEPDMRYPIQYALTYPDRCPSGMRSRISGFPRLTFARLDQERYPCFGLAREAASAGGTAPTILNAANEVAVGAFLAGKIGFDAIGEVIGSALSALPRAAVTGLDDIVSADAEARNWLLDKYSLGGIEISAALQNRNNQDLKGI
jgi:1-deoxy-D-xylulose-5-phosphate reductoisomerase